jgi:hypothetical protein
MLYVYEVKTLVPSPMGHTYVDQPRFSFNHPDWIDTKVEFGADGYCDCVGEIPLSRIRDNGGER